MTPLYIGTVVSSRDLTVRTGPGTEYPINDSVILHPGDQIYISSIEKSGSSYWAAIEAGYAKLSQGSDIYIKHELMPKVSLMRATRTSVDSSTPWNSFKYKTPTVTKPNSTFQTPSPVTTAAGQYVVNGSMRLFGLPYQFNEACDPRYDDCSPVVGREFAQKFFGDACVMYVIPGKARFLSNRHDRHNSTSHALIAASNDNMKPLQSKLSDAAHKTLRFYDFEEDYTNYMKYVNVMCRTVATFLELHEGLDVKGKTVSFQKYDWKNYRWEREEYQSMAGGFVKRAKERLLRTIQNLKSDGDDEGSNISSTVINIEDGTDGSQLNLDQLGQSANFTAYYIDPSVNCDESASNSTSPSSIEGKLDTLSSNAKEWGFILNSAGGAELMDQLGADSVDLFSGLADGIIGNRGALTSSLNKILSAGSSVIKGENIILPEVYQTSEYQRDYSITVHLRSPYGSKLAIYLNVIVPMLHLLALALPKQATPNTYGSPFLLKCYVPGVFNCNLGIVTSINIRKASNEDAWSVDGLPTEMDVTLNIKDLYSRLTMSPSNEPWLFLNNSSMVEYLSTISGLNLITPLLRTKLSMISNVISNSVTDVPRNIGSLFTDGIEKKFRSLIQL